MMFERQPFACTISRVAKTSRNVRHDHVDRQRGLARREHRHHSMAEAGTLPKHRVLAVAGCEGVDNDLVFLMLQLPCVTLVMIQTTREIKHDSRNFDVVGLVVLPISIPSWRTVEGSRGYGM